MEMLVIAVAVVVVFLLTLFLKKTIIGASILAMAQNREGAFLVGINANAVAMMTFAISGALGVIGRRGEKPAIPLNLVGDFGGGGFDDFGGGFDDVGW